MLRVLFTYRIGRVMEIDRMITKKEDLINTYVKTHQSFVGSLFLLRLNLG
ncbi:hypothetical protein VP466E531_P0087 [Vibrio phage 466E53-1]|nr:hypothetical protein VP466E531_P0087 [Vibrio phage 466E53-1]